MASDDLPAPGTIRVFFGGLLGVLLIVVAFSLDGVEQLLVGGLGGILTLVFWSWYVVLRTREEKAGQRRKSG